MGIRYRIETTPPDWWNNKLYMGEPSDESEIAWNDLIHRACPSRLREYFLLNAAANREHGVRIFRDEAARLDINNSILLPDNNFAVILSVIHNLHCLVRSLLKLCSSILIEILETYASTTLRRPLLFESD